MLIFEKDTSISLRPHIEQFHCLYLQETCIFFNIKFFEDPGSASMAHLTSTPPLQLFIAGEAREKKVIHELSKCC